MKGFVLTIIAMLAFALALPGSRQQVNFFNKVNYEGVVSAII